MVTFRNTKYSTCISRYYTLNISQRPCLAGTRLSARHKAHCLRYAVTLMFLRDSARGRCQAEWWGEPRDNTLPFETVERQGASARYDTSEIVIVPYENSMIGSRDRSTPSCSTTRKRYRGGRSLRRTYLTQLIYSRRCKCSSPIVLKLRKTCESDREVFK